MLSDLLLIYVQLINMLPIIKLNVLNGNGLK